MVAQHYPPPPFPGPPPPSLLRLIWFVRNETIRQPRSVHTRACSWVRASYLCPKSLPLLDRLLGGPSEVLDEGCGLSKVLHTQPKSFRNTAVSPTTGTVFCRSPMWRRLAASRCSVIMLPELKPDLSENVAVGSSAKAESCEKFGGTAWL